MQIAKKRNFILSNKIIPIEIDYCYPNGQVKLDSSFSLQNGMYIEIKCRQNITSSVVACLLGNNKSIRLNEYTHADRQIAVRFNPNGEWWTTSNSSFGFRGNQFHTVFIGPFNENTSQSMITLQLDGISKQHQWNSKPATVSFEKDSNIYFFSTNNNNIVSSPCISENTGSISYVKFLDSNNTIIRYFQAAKNNNVVGFYEKITNTFISPSEGTLYEGVF